MVSVTPYSRTALVHCEEHLDSCVFYHTYGRLNKLIPQSLFFQLKVQVWFLSIEPFVSDANPTTQLLKQVPILSSSMLLSFRFWNQDGGDVFVLAVIKIVGLPKKMWAIELSCKHLSAQGTPN